MRPQSWAKPLCTARSDAHLWNDAWQVYRSAVWQYCSLNHITRPELRIVDNICGRIDPASRYLRVLQCLQHVRERSSRAPSSDDGVESVRRPYAPVISSK